MLILAGTLLTYNHSSEKQINIFRNRSVFISVLNQAKSLAIQKFYQIQEACAFGVYINTSISQYILFQDLKIDQTKDCKDDNGLYNNADSAYTDDNEKLQSFSLDSGFEFDGGNATILFLPPDLTTIAMPPLPLTFTIKTLDNSLSTSLQINEGGQIVTQ